MATIISNNHGKLKSFQIKRISKSNLFHFHFTWWNFIHVYILLMTYRIILLGRSYRILLLDVSRFSGESQFILKLIYLFNQTNELHTSVSIVVVSMGILNGYVISNAKQIHSIRLILNWWKTLHYVTNFQANGKFVLVSAMSIWHMYIEHTCR